MKEHHSGFQRFSSVWDALEDTPQDAARMRLLTNMMRALSREDSPVRPTTSMSEADRRLYLFLWISGFLKDDDALKCELTVGLESESAISAAKGRKSLDESPNGKWLLTPDQAQKTAWR